MKVILLNLHGARVDAFGAYGSSWVTTPNLDRLAADGVVFDHHYAEKIEYKPPDKSPGRPTLDRTDFLGGHLLGIVSSLDARQVPTACFRDARLGQGLTDRFKFVAQVQAADLAVLEQPTITDGVFQLAIDWLQEYGRHYADWLVTLELGALLPPWNEKEQLRKGPGSESEVEGAPEELGSALPRFDYQDTGAPEPPTDRFGWKSAYAGAMQYVDDLIGQFRNLLRELGLDGECLISVTSFQGQPLGERSGVPARDLGLHEELVHLPLLLRLPGGQSAGRRVHHLTGIRNWCGLLAEAFGIPECTPGPQDSLLGLARGHGQRLNDYLVTEAMVFPSSRPEEIAVRTSNWHLILPRLGWQQRPVQLYRKPEDRWEMNNVIKEHPDVGDHLELTWYRHRHRQESEGKAEPPVLRDDLVKVVAS